MRSLIVLKALTYAPTGGIVAAITTSLPEVLGGSRNWDYRYCWIRDATLTLDALACSGFLAEARAWRDWLLRAVAGTPSQAQIMYSVTGERRLSEYELPWLRGYEDSRPVRVGNAAHRQLQLDLYGEIMDSFHLDRVHRLKASDEDWRVQQVLLEALEAALDRIRSHRAGLFEPAARCPRCPQLLASAMLAGVRLSALSRHSSRPPPPIRSRQQ